MNNNGDAEFRQFNGARNFFLATLHVQQQHLDTLSSEKKQKTAIKLIPNKKKKAEALTIENKKRRGKSDKAKRVAFSSFGESEREKQKGFLSKMKMNVTYRHYFCIV